MAEIGKHRLSRGISRQSLEAGGDRGDRTVPSHETAAEQTREAMERKGARSSEMSSRDRMVDIGRVNQQAGRQGQ